VVAWVVFSSIQLSDSGSNVLDESCLCKSGWDYFRDKAANAAMRVILSPGVEPGGGFFHPKKRNAI